MSIKRYDIEVATRYAFINECESEKGYYVRSEDHAAEVARLNEQLEAAEAQVKELTADLDKESEIRHRIHEELNAIKGEQQPVGAFHISGGEVEATSDYIEPGNWPVNDGIVEVYAHPAPARLPPEIDVNDPALGAKEKYGAQCYNRALREAAALGAKPLPVIEFDGADMDSARGITGEGDEYCRGFIDGLLDGADQVRAAGLEVKS